MKDFYAALLVLLSSLFPLSASSQIYYEIDGSPFSTQGAPLPQNLKVSGEKLILVDPREHAWGAYGANGRLIRWGIATTGANWCRESQQSCRTNSGTYRIYHLGSESCVSSKYPLPTGGAPMPYCMYFNGSQALHGSYEVEYANASHGCVRIHVDDAKWLRYHFVEGPSMANHFRGTRVVIKSY